MIRPLYQLKCDAHIHFWKIHTQSYKTDPHYTDQLILASTATGIIVHSSWCPVPTHKYVHMQVNVPFGMFSGQWLEVQPCPIHH